VENEVGFLRDHGAHGISWALLVLCFALALSPAPQPAGDRAASGGAEVDADTAECIVAKNRHGETSTVPLGWDGAHTRFMDVDFKR